MCFQVVCFRFRFLISWRLFSSPCRPSPLPLPASSMVLALARPLSLSLSPSASASFRLSSARTGDNARCVYSVGYRRKDEVLPLRASSTEDREASVLLASSSSAFPFPPPSLSTINPCAAPSRPLFRSLNCSVPARETNARPKASHRARRWTESSTPWARGGPWIGCRSSSVSGKKKKDLLDENECILARAGLVVPWPCSWR